MYSEAKIFFLCPTGCLNNTHFLFNTQRAYLEERRLWWVDNEVAQSEAKPLWVFLKVNGPWTLPPHALHLTHWQRPVPIFIGWHQAISPPFSLLKIEECTKCLDQYHLSVGNRDKTLPCLSLSRGVRWDCAYNCVLIICCTHVKEVGVGGRGHMWSINWGLCPSLVRAEFHQCQKFFKLSLSKGEALFHQHPYI